MTREEIRELVIKTIADTNELTNVVDTIFKEISDAWLKGYNRGKYDPEFDNEDD